MLVSLLICFQSILPIGCELSKQCITLLLNYPLTLGIWKRLLWCGLLCTAVVHTFLNVDSFLRKDQLALKYWVKCVPLLNEMTCIKHCAYVGTQERLGL